MAGLAVAAANALPSLPAAAAAAPAPAATGTTLRAWGVNTVGQLGDGTTTERLAPVKVQLSPGVTVTSVRSNCGHTVALTGTGQVLGWGGNAEGELGDGTTTSSPLPVQALIPAGVTVTAVRAGCGHSLALTSTGQVLAWGSNDDGELGDGTTTGSDVPVPVSLTAGTMVTAISAGIHDSLALTSAGQVLGWGFNGEGELGDGTTTNRAVPVQAQIPAGVTVTSVAAGGTQSLAVTSTGQVFAWGRNLEGQLGDGTVTGSPRPVRVKLAQDTTVSGVSAGCLHSLARTSTGQVLAWGIASDGELGIGTHPALRSTPVRVKLPAGVTATAIGAGPEAFTGFAVVRPAP